MDVRIKADMLKTLGALSKACDLTSLRLMNHSERVCYLSLRMAQHINLPKEETETLLTAAFLHDIGVGSSREKNALVETELHPSVVTRHCQKGYRLLEKTNLFRHIAPIILHHHDDYTDELPLASAIIRLADWIDVHLNRNQYALWQVDAIKESIATDTKSFHPKLVAEFLKMSTVPSLWLDLETGHFREYLYQGYTHERREFGLMELDELSQVFSQIIDTRSPYTANHSLGVARIASKVGQILGFPPYHQKSLEIAGLLHDLGKLAIPDEILLSPKALTKEERQVMFQHTYHTYHLIGAIGEGIKDIQETASFHHEKLSGYGYPFGLKGESLSLDARIMAVADITQALTEDRPYRKKMPRYRVEKILLSEVEEGHLDRKVVHLVLDHLDELTATKEELQT